MMAKQIEDFLKDLRDADSHVRYTAAMELVNIGDARAVEPLLAALKDKDYDVRRVAAKALGKIGDARTVEPLIAALKDGSKGAAEALGNIGDARAVEPLLAALKDEDSDVRRVAAEALGKIGDAKAVEPLIAALKDGMKCVREAAAEALGKITTDWPKTDEAKKQVLESIAALKDGDKYARCAAAEVLGNIGDARTVEPLIATLKDEDSDVRRVAAKALGKIGDAKAVEPLIAALKDGMKCVSEAAANALGNIGDARALEPLIAAMKYPDDIVQASVSSALEKISPDWPKTDEAKKQVPEFIAALNNKNWYVRRGAATALGRIAPDRPKPAESEKKLGDLNKCGRCQAVGLGSNSAWVTDAPAGMYDSWCYTCISAVKNGASAILDGVSIDRHGFVINNKKKKEKKENRIEHFAPKTVLKDVPSCGITGKIIGFLTLVAVGYYFCIFVLPGVLSRRMEGQTKENLTAIREALSIYYGDHFDLQDGYPYPHSLDELIKNGKYLEEIPIVNTLHHGATNKVTTYQESIWKYPSISKDTGGWGYVNNPDPKNFGAVFIDCTHTDSKGRFWYSY